MTKTRGILVIGLFVFALVAGATWAFAQEDSGLIHACVKNANGQIRIVAAGAACGHNESPLTWGSGGGGGGNGGGVFTWQTQAFAYLETVGLEPIPMPSNGTLTAVAISPLFNSSPNPVRIAVFVNGSPSALSVEIPPGSMSVGLGTASITVEAGDLVAVRTNAIFVCDPYPGPYPAPDPNLPPCPSSEGIAFHYRGSLQFVSD